MVLFNIYDDWLRSISSYTAFSRFVVVRVCVCVRMSVCVWGGAWIERPPLPVRLHTGLRRRPPHTAPPPTHLPPPG